MSEQKNNQVSIGQKLHDARIANKYTLDDLQNITKIQKRYLIAIEEDHFDDLPGDFYVRAFVKQYADTVGLNGNELLKDYNNNLPDTNDPNYVNQVSENKIKTRNDQSKSDNRYSFVRKYLPITSIVIIVLIIIIAVWFAAAKSDSGNTHINNNSVSVSGSSSSSMSSSDNKKSSNNKKKTSNNNKKVNQKSKNKSKIKTSIRKTSGSGSNTTYQINSNVKSNIIKISSSDKAWVAIKDNNQTVWQGSQNSGASHKVKLSSNTKNASINLGNAPKNTVKINGEKLNLDTNSQVQSVNLNFK